MLAALSATAVNLCIPAQPVIAEAFGVRKEAGGLVVSAYLLGYGPGQMLWGPLADRYGRIRPLFAGLLGFLLFTIACPFARSFETLTYLRTLQGVFGGSTPVIARAIARDQGGGKKTARLLATISIIFGAAPLLAPILGSALLLVASWPLQFWFLALLTLTLFFAFQVSVRPAVHEGTGDAVSLRGYWAGSAALFGERDFVVGCGSLSLLVFGYSTLLSVGPALAETRYGVPPEGYGLLFAVPAATTILGPWLSRRLLRTRTAAQALHLGMLLSAGASVALLPMASGEVPLAVLWGAVTVYVFGLGMALPLGSAMALEPAGENAGIASSLLGALPNIAAALGAAFATSTVFASGYQALCLIMAGSGIAGLLLVLALGRQP